MSSAKKSIIHLQEYSECKMLFSLSWPVAMSLMVQGIYNLVDSIFISSFGAEALSAVSLSFVVQGLATSFFTGIATGLNALISKYIGAEQLVEGKNAVKSGVSLQLIFALLFMLFGFCGVGYYFKGTTDNAQVIDYGIQYLTILMVFCPVMASQITSERLLQSTGMTQYMLYAQIGGTITNIILDPILIFGFLGFPEMGIRGAAYATVIGQFIATILAMFLNFKYNTLIFSSFKESRFEWQMVWKIAKIGIPTAATGFSSSFGNYFINRILISFSAAATAAFGVYAKLQSIALMPTEGMSAGLVTMYSFFYGKKDLSRIDKTIKSGEIMVEVWNIICFIVFFFFPVLLMQPFHPTAEMIDVGIICFKTIGFTYLTSGLMTGLTAFFQATGNSIFTFFVSLSRTVFVRVPVAYYLKQFKQINLIWLCWPISEVVSDTVCVILFIICYKKIRKELKRDNM